MAIKIQGSTIIDDSRKVINASHVGIGTTNPTVELDVDGQANISGIVTASSFVKSSNSGGFLKADGTEDTSTYLTSFTETNDLSSAVTWANVPDANITESSVTQHQAALSITESQISDLQSYLTSYTETQTLDDVVGLGSATTQTITVGTATTGVVVRPDGTLKASGIATAQKFVVEGGSSTGFLKADGSIDNSPYATGTGTLDSIVIKDDSQNVGSASTFTSIDFYNGIGVSTTGVVGVASVRLEDNISISGIFTAATFSGSGSGLTSIPTSALVGLATDADKLDGQQGSYYLNYSNFSGIATDSDKLDGIQASSFLRSDQNDSFTSGTLTFTTASSGIKIEDLSVLKLGSGTQDFSATHNGTDTYFTNRTGDLIIQTIDTGDNGNGDDIIIKAGTGKTSIFAHNNGAVELWNNGSKKLETTGIGVSIVGAGNTATITGPSNLVLDPSPVGVGTTSGTVIILGDLQVDGTQTIINSTTLEVDDKLISIAKSATNATQANGAGLEINGASATFTYASSGDKWVANKSIEATSFIKNGGASTEFLKADGSVDSSTYLTSYTETNDLSSAVTWANVPDANITESSVTQHQAALSITESQISDLQSYLTSYTETQTLNDVVGLGSATTQTITVGTATTGVLIRPNGTLDISGTVGIGTRIDIIPYDTQNNGTLSFEGSAGQLFSITNQLSSGSIFSVNDISGIPSIDVNADGTIQLAPVGAGESVGIGTTNPKYKLHVVGTTNIDGTFTVNGAPVQTGSGVASTITVADESSDTTCFPLFSTDATGDINPKTGSNLTFNSSTGTLGAGGLNISGIVTVGTATTGVVVRENGTLNVSGLSTFRDYLRVNANSSDSRLYVGSGPSSNQAELRHTNGYSYLYHYGNNTFHIALAAGSTNKIQFDTISKKMCEMYRDGSVNLYYDGSEKFATTGYGVTVIGGLNVSGISTFQSTVGIGTRIDIIPYDTQNNGTLSFEGSAGQLFSITNQLSSGSIFSVNDISGIPSIDVNADGTIQLAPVGAGESVGIGTTNPQYKLHVVGNTNIDGTFTVNGSPVSGGSGISNVSEDTTPQLGGTLDTNGNLIQFGDSASATDDRLQFGASQDLQIYHDGSHNYIETIVSGANLRIKQAGAGGVELYANAPKILFNDINGGTQIDFSIKDENGSFTITDETNSDTVLNYTQNAALELYYNNSKKFETTGAGVTVTGGLYVSGISTFQNHVTLGDDDEIQFGDDNDAIIKVDGSQNFILQGDGTTYLRGSTVIVGANGGAGGFETGIRVNEVSSETSQVELYYDNSLRLETIGAGVTVTGGLYVSGISTFQDDIEVTGNIEKYDTLVGSGSTTVVEFAVTVAAKSDHRYTGGVNGASTFGYYLDGIESPFLTLTPGRTYKFDQSDSSNNSHPLRFYLEADKTTQYTTNVTTNGTAGLSGAYTQILVTDETPIVLHYQCSAHPYMGNAVQVNSNKVNTPYLIEGLSGANITGVVTATGFATTNGTSSQFLKADGSVDSSTYLTSYTETDPVVAAINGIVKSNGTTISAATAGTDYLTPSGDGSGLSGLTGAGVGTYGSSTVSPIITVNSDGRITGITTAAISGGGGSSVWTTSGNDAYYTTGNIGIGTVSPVSDLDVRGLVTIQNLSGNNYNENLRLGRSNGGYSSIAFAANVANSSGTVAGQFTHLVYPSNTNSGDFAIRANSTDALRITTSGTPQLLNAGNKKLETRTDGIAVAGIVTAISGVVTYYGDASNLTNTTNASSGTYGSSTEAAQISVDSQGRITGITNVSIVSASNATPTIRTTHNFTTTDGQTLFPPTGTIGFTSSYVDVFYNGVRLEAAEYTENVTGSSGTSITLTTPAGLNDIVDIVAYESIGISTVNLLGDTTPQLGGDLDLNGFDITGTGSMNITGIATANGGQLQTEADVIAIAIALG